MGWRTYSIDLATEVEAMTSKRAAVADAVAWALILAGLWLVACS